MRKTVLKETKKIKQQSGNNETEVRYGQHRFEWKQTEQKLAEIAFSQMRMKDGVDPYEYFSNKIADKRNQDNNADTFFQKFYDFFDPNTTQLKDLILKIAFKPGCLSEQRLEALQLYFMGKNKRDITQILHPQRQFEQERNQGTVGIEVYVQRMLNHYIPIALRTYAEQHYPYLMKKSFDYLPINDEFVAKYWIKSLGENNDNFDDFLKKFNNNPHALYALLNLLKKKKKDIRKVFSNNDNDKKKNPNYFVSLSMIKKTTKYFLKFLTFKYNGDLDKIIDALKVHGPVCNGILIYLYLCLKKTESVKQILKTKEVFIQPAIQLGKPSYIPVLDLDIRDISQYSLFSQQDISNIFINMNANKEKRKYIKKIPVVNYQQSYYSIF